MSLGLIPALPIPAADIEKALPGATRGLGYERPGHKYIKRVRTWTPKGPSWRYYYRPEDVPGARQRARSSAAAHARIVEHAGGGVAEAPLSPDEAEKMHQPIEQFKKDYPNTRLQVRALKDLSAEGVEKLVPGQAFSVEMSEAVASRYHRAMIEKYGDDEPESLLARPMSALRAAEAALEKLPPKVHSLLQKRAVHIRFVDTTVDRVPELIEHKNWAGFANPDGRIVVDAHRGAFLGARGEARMSGGLFPVEILAHEIGHHVSYAIGSQKEPPGGDWGGWMDFLTHGGSEEPGVTPYAETSPMERFADSFAAAILFPRQLATTAPKTYDWFHQFLEGGIPARLTDDDKLAVAQEKRTQLLRGNPSDAELATADLEIQGATGLDQIPDDDPRIKWWSTGRENHIQRLLRTEPRPSRAPNIERRDPVSPLETGDVKRDRFFEWSMNGRSVYLRMGPTLGKPTCDWAPTPSGIKGELDFNNVKELYAEDGTPLNPLAAWWWLNQDQPGADAGKLLSFSRGVYQTGTGKERQLPDVAVNRNRALVIAHEPQTMMKALAATAFGKATRVSKFQDEKQAKAWLPVEINERDFRLRSGTFTFDRWKRSGDDILKELSNTPPGSAKRDDLMAELRKVQPFIALSQQQDPVTGRYLKPEVRQQSLPEGARGDWGPHPVPILASVNYENPNPDGSKTIIRCDWDDKANAHFIADSALRELLTPNGEAIVSAEDLVSRCKEAADAKRTAWISVQTEPVKGSDLPGYYHVQVQFDGRGSPRVLGSFWPSYLHVEEPRLEDLLKSAGYVPGSRQERETGRAKVIGPSIKLERHKPPTGKAAIPKVGDRVLLKVRGAEVGRVDDQKAMVECIGVSPNAEGRMQYVFAGVSGSGFPGRRFVREGVRATMADVEHLVPVAEPEPLARFPLIYVHRELDSKTGDVGTADVRMRLPADGSLSAERVAAIPGIIAVDDNTFKIGFDKFHTLRETLSGVVMTEDADRMLHDRVEAYHKDVSGPKDAYIKAADVDPIKLQALGVGVKAETPEGAPIEYGSHQKALVQAFFDAGQRLLAWHAPGTGKTIEAIVAAQIALARRDPADPSKPHPMAPKKIAIVVPKNVLDQWKGEAELFGEGAIVVGNGANYVSIKDYTEHPERYSARLVIFGHEYWTRYAAEIKKQGFDGLIVDEIHEGTRDETNARVKALRAWAPDMKMQLLLSGTPVTKTLSDLVEMVKLLSNNTVWGGLDAKTFEDIYLTENPAFKATGATRGQRRTGPKTFLKPEMADEVAAVIGRLANVAMPKDIRDKTLPAVRMGDSDVAEMVGIQAALYAANMARLGDQDRALLQSGAITEEHEMSRLSGTGRQAMDEARRLANCPAYKPESTEPWVTYSKLVPKQGQKGEFETISEPLTTPDPEWLMDAKKRKRAGKWPLVEELGQDQAALWALHFHDVLGTYNYSEVAGKRITKEQLARAKEAGWERGKRIANPDVGPAGIRCRGYSEYVGQVPEAERALEFQRAYANAIQRGFPKEEAGKYEKLGAAATLMRAASEWGITAEEGERLLSTSPTAFKHHSTVEWGGVKVREGEQWYADKSGSQWLLYRPEDWDMKEGRPRTAGGFEAVQDGDEVAVEGWKWSKDPDTKEPVVGTLKYIKELGEDSKGRVYLQDEDGETVGPVEKAKISKPMRNLLDPGMRSDRAKADVAMVRGNAKAEKLIERTNRYFQTTGPGPDGERQLIYFAHNILDGCRTIEASLRMMGFMDVNEAVDGSRNYDPTDPRAKTGAPNKRYFVTYIGSTYTGDRVLNSEIFKKQKDKLGRDSKTSMFVYRTMSGRSWPSALRYGGDFGVQLPRWSDNERGRIQRQFKIEVPEAYTKDADGTIRFFYGSTDARRTMRQLEGIKDPAYLADAEEAEQTRQKIIELKKKYADIVKAGAVTRSPLNAKQTDIFNNCAAMVASDAANVGLNWGNATEVIEYDTPASPMDEWQRVARAARMLPKAVSKKLWGTEKEPGPFRKIHDQERKFFKPIKPASGGGYLKSCAVAGMPPFEQPTSVLAVLDAVAHSAKLAALSAPSTAIKDGWEAIRGRAEAAKAFGRDEMAGALDEFRTMRVPGGTQPVVRYNEQDLFLPRPEAGTYDKIEMTSAVSAINAAFDALPSEDQKAVEKAGLAKTGTVDATAVYLAIRAQQILDHIDKRRPEVARDLRGSPVGAAVTDNDVMNAIVDELSPEDRAILKTRKYLVNVYRISPAVSLPQFLKRTVKTEEGGSSTESIFTGYERQYPIQPEALSRAIARSRQGPIEALLRRIEQGISARSPVDYWQMAPESAAAMSALHKAEVIPALFIVIGGGDA